METYIRKAIWNSWNVLAKQAAQSYIAGPELGDAMRVCRRLLDRGFITTIGYWNTDEDPVDSVSENYRAAVQQLSRTDRACSLSIKVPAIDYSIQKVSELLRNAREAGGIRIHFDSLGPETVDRTWALIEEVRAMHDQIGCTLPSRWPRSLLDAEWAIDRGLTIRVVKGQWSSPGHKNDCAQDRSERFLDIIDLLAGRARHVGVATHDLRLAEASIKKLRAAGTSCELELLYGLPSSGSIQLARTLGVGIRFYIPYGCGFLPYCLSTIRKKPHIIWWIMKDIIKGRFRGL